MGVWSAGIIFPNCAAVFVLSEDRHLRRTEKKVEVPQKGRERESCIKDNICVHLSILFGLNTSMHVINSSRFYEIRSFFCYSKQFDLSTISPQTQCNCRKFMKYRRKLVSVYAGAIYLDNGVKLSNIVIDTVEAKMKYRWQE